MPEPIPPITASSAAPQKMTLLARLARVVDTVIERVETVENHIGVSASAAPSARAGTTPAPVARGTDRPKPPLVSVWNSIEAMARRLVAVENAQPELLDMIAQLEGRIAQLEAQRQEEI